jgi:ParB family chromosome partitioning protein
MAKTKTQPALVGATGSASARVQGPVKKQPLIVTRRRLRADGTAARTSGTSVAAAGPRAERAASLDRVRSNDEVLVAESGTLLRLDPARIRDASWQPRTESSFHGPEFEQLKIEIEHAGGNVQPVMVFPDAADGFIAIFGHRRIRACRELGLPVLAVVRNDGGNELQRLQQLWQENRARSDLTAWEAARLVKRLLDAAVFPSARRLAEGMGMSHTWVNTLLSLLKLPTDVIAILEKKPAPSARQARRLFEAVEADRAGVLARAGQLTQSQSAKRLSTSATINALLGHSRTTSQATDYGGSGMYAVRSVPIVESRPDLGSWHRDDVGRVVVTLAAGVDPEFILAHVAAALSREVAHGPRDGAGIVRQANLKDAAQAGTADHGSRTSVFSAPPKPATGDAVMPGNAAAACGYDQLLAFARRRLGNHIRTGQFLLMLATWRDAEQGPGGPAVRFEATDAVSDADVRRLQEIADDLDPVLRAVLSDVLTYARTVASEAGQLAALDVARSQLGVDFAS